jgi:hypothetical protein
MNKDLITAYVDNEIKDSLVVNQVKNNIENDEVFASEYIVQSFCKRIVKDKVQKNSAPDYLYKRILDEIKPKETASKKNNNFIFDIFYKPSFSFATAIIIVIAFLLVIINRYYTPSVPEIDFANLKADNMFYQAVNNYRLILNGQLTPQFVSDCSTEICDYFSKNGVSYSTVVPVFKEWKLHGAVISSDKGTKLAHHVYLGQNNEIIYVFQVEEEYINNIVNLNPDLLNYLDSGNCFTEVIDDKLVVFKRKDQNIFAVVSNGDFENVKNNFCSLN